MAPLVGIVARHVVGAERWGPAAPWLDVTTTLRPLQPRLPRAIATEDRASAPFGGASQQAWDFLDTLELDFPRRGN